MYVDTSETKNVRIFFIIFYYLSVVIGLNIVIAFAIDMFGAIERLEEQQEEHEDLLWDIAKKVKVRKEDDEAAPSLFVHKKFSVKLKAPETIPE